MSLLTLTTDTNIRDDAQGLAPARKNIILVHITKQGRIPWRTIPRFDPCLLFYFHKMCPLTDLKLNCESHYAFCFPHEPLIFYLND